MLWEILSPSIHVDITLTHRHTTYLKIAADQIHPLMAMMFHDDSGLFQQDKAPCNTAKIYRNGLMKILAPGVALGSTFSRSQCD